jgi:hypothetical protein
VILTLALAAAVALDTSDIGAPDPSACSNPDLRGALLTRYMDLLLQAQHSKQVPGAAAAKQRAKIAADRLLERIHRLAQMARWSPRQEGNFAWQIQYNAQIRAFQTEFIQDLTGMKILAPDLDASDSARRCKATVHFVVLLDKVNTIDERKIAAMSAMVDAEAEKLGLTLN